MLFTLFDIPYFLRFVIIALLSVHLVLFCPVISCSSVIFKFFRYKILFPEDRLKERQRNGGVGQGEGGGGLMSHPSEFCSTHRDGSFGYTHPLVLRNALVSVHLHIPGDPHSVQWGTLVSVYLHIPGDPHSVQWGTLVSVHLHIPLDPQSIQLWNTFQCTSASIPGVFSWGTLFSVPLPIVYQVTL